MSSKPGEHLEDYLAWCYNLKVVDQQEANLSLGLAAHFGLNVDVRPCLTQEEFAVIVSLFEPLREQIESALDAFDEETMSWRGYSGGAFFFVDNARDQQVADYLTGLK